MATLKGRAAFGQRMAQNREALESRILRGAARAAADIVADEAKRLSVSDDVSAAIKVSTKRKDTSITARVMVVGKGAYLAPWLEYGTSPHFISVDPAQSMGMTVGRINRLGKAGTLVIGGKFVGDTVYHPGAQPHPFLRPALDTKERDAVAAAQTYLTAKTKGGA